MQVEIHIDLTFLDDWKENRYYMTMHRDNGQMVLTTKIDREEAKRIFRTGCVRYKQRGRYGNNITTQFFLL